MRQCPKIDTPAPRPGLTIDTPHAAACGLPSALSIACVEQRDGAQWRIMLHRATRVANLRHGDADWGRAHAVHDGRVDAWVLALEDAA